MKQLLFLPLFVWLQAAGAQQLRMSVDGSTDTVVAISSLTETSGIGFQFSDSAHHGQPAIHSFHCAIKVAKGPTSIFNGLTYCKRDVWFIVNRLMNSAPGTELSIYNVQYQAAGQPLRTSPQQFRITLR